MDDETCIFSDRGETHDDQIMILESDRYFASNYVEP